MVRGRKKYDQLSDVLRKLEELSWAPATLLLERAWSTNARHRRWLVMPPWLDRRPSRPQHSVTYQVSDTALLAPAVPTLRLPWRRHGEQWAIRTT